MNSQAVESYRESGIWTGQSLRSSCVVPEIPLLISRAEERELSDLSFAVWRSLENVIDMTRETKLLPWASIMNQAKAFPDGLTMPPAVRVDVVRTMSGPKIVEVDPITAISLGETTFLTDYWYKAGYQVFDPPTKAIKSAFERLGSTALEVQKPISKADYWSELSYLERSLEAEGIDLYRVGNRDGVVQLSAYIEDPAMRKALNSGRKNFAVNPLWGSLIGLSNKSNLNLMSTADKVRLPKYLPRLYEIDELAESGDTLVVCKPIVGTGSGGIRVAEGKNAVNLKGSYIFHELLVPIEDEFGLCVAGTRNICNGRWISRLSLYASRTGLAGFQVTARQKTGEFTNAHGQADAVQTTAAVKD